MKPGDMLELKGFGGFGRWWCHIIQSGSDIKTLIELVGTSSYHSKTILLEVGEPVVFLSGEIREGKHSIIFLHPVHGTCFAYCLPDVYFTKVEVS